MALRFSKNETGHHLFIPQSLAVLYYQKRESKTDIILFFNETNLQWIVIKKTEYSCMSYSPHSHPCPPLFFRGEVFSLLPPKKSRLFLTLASHPR